MPRFPQSSSLLLGPLRIGRLAVFLAGALTATDYAQAQEEVAEQVHQSVRSDASLATQLAQSAVFATFNVSLHRRRAGQLAAELSTGGCAQARQLAEIIQTVRPDVLLLNEIDYEQDDRCVRLFADRYLAVSQNGKEPIRYAFRFAAPVNTGVPSGMDLDGDGQSEGPGDCWGYGAYPGQYGMAILSRFPIDAASARTFQSFLWTDMPDAMLPKAPGSNDPFYPAEVSGRLRLSS